MFIKQGDTYYNGEYTIYEKQQIGRGAYGIVCECKGVNQKDVLLCAKIIKSISNNSNYLQRESEIINTLRQAYPDNLNLVKVYFCQYQKFDNNDFLIVIMEKCNSNLKDELKIKQKYTSDEVLNIFRQLLNGYKPLYEKSILHRDIKPENILISYDKQNKPIYKLADFGVGKTYASNDTTMTKVGTPVYAAPELNTFVNDRNLDDACQQLKNFKNGKSQVDVYSIGIMLYQFLFGVPPFETQYTEQLSAFFNNLRITPFKIKQPTQDINPDLVDIIEKMIVYDPLKRIKFFEIYGHKLISIQTQVPIKFDQIPKKQSKEMKFNPIEINLRATNPSQNTNPFIQIQPNPNRMTLNNNPNRMTSFNPPNTETKYFAPTQQQFNQIQIDELNDPQNYLKTQLSENSFFYCKQTVKLMEQVLDSIKRNDAQQMIQLSNQLKDCYTLEENGTYSLEFLKFYYCVLMKAKQFQKRNFNNKQDLQQEIKNIIQKKP